MYKLKNLIQSLIYPIWLLNDFCWMMEYKWGSLLLSIISLIMVVILLGYTTDIVKKGYSILFTLMGANTSLMINSLFDVSWFNFSSLSIVFFVVGIYLIIRIMPDIINEYRNS